MRPVLLIVALVAAGSLSGCATKEFVLEEAGKVDRRVAALEQALTEAKTQVQERLKKNEGRLDARDAHATTQDQRLAALGEQHARIDKTVAEHAQRVQGAEKGLQLARVDLSAAQSRLDHQDKQVASLQSGLDEDRKTTQQAMQAQGQRIAGAEQGLQRVSTDLATAQSHLEGQGKQLQTQTQSLNQQIDQTQGHLEQQGKKVDTLSVGLDASRQALTEHGQRLNQTETQSKAAASERASIATTANDALSRANAAGKLAEGKLMYASVLNHAMSGFTLDHAELGVDAKAALMAFAETLKAENANVYLEIQGHTDTSGKAETNRLLSQHRAEAVRDFLYAECGIPLHRMAVFAYGGNRPVADNKKREGRIQNRRVVIVVLK